MNLFKSIDLKGFGEKYQGKVRDCFTKDQKIILVSTDRISAFDRVLGYIPFKGQVLNLLATFWFEKTKDIIENHVISIPDPNVTIAKRAKPVPLEMVVRGYITGVTDTSIWGSYEKGERIIYGVKFPEGLKKNDKLPTPVITPTTKAKSGHDERITKKEILKQKIVSKEIYEQIEKASLALFRRGQKIAEKSGIILVDTKYEFGIYNKKLIIMDEIHTPDSSRFWIKKTYKKRLKKGLEPESIDKEFLRLWYKKRGYKGDGKPPQMTQDFIKQLSKRYIDIYEKITSKKFIYPKGSIPQRIKKNLKSLPIRIVVLTSNIGTGTNLQAIIDATKNKIINGNIIAVVSDVPSTPASDKAKKHKIPVILCPKKEELLNILMTIVPDYIALAGWKQIITKEVIDNFPNKILNTHPGLIPDKIDGMVKNPDKTIALWNKGKMTDKAIQNFLDKKATYAGCSNHFLTHEFDFGPVLGRCFEKIKKNDTVESLYKKLKKKENKLYVSVLRKLTRQKLI